MLFAEAVYLLGFSTASYRSNVNRRLKLSKNQPDREAILIQLRRERGLTSDGLFRFGVQWFNRLMLESGMTRGVLTLALVALVGGRRARSSACSSFAASLLEAACAALVAALLFPFVTLLVQAQAAPRQIRRAVSRRDGHHRALAARRPSGAGRDRPGRAGTARSDRHRVRHRGRRDHLRRRRRDRDAQSLFPRRPGGPAAVRHRGAIQGSTGGNLSEILSNLSSVIRQRFKMRRKIKALAAEGKFSAMFLSGLPIAVFCLLNVMTPDFYGQHHGSTTSPRSGLGLAGAWMMLGNIVMYKMCNFRI